MGSPTSSAARVRRQEAVSQQNGLFLLGITTWAVAVALFASGHGTISLVTPSASLFSLIIDPVKQALAGNLTADEGRESVLRLSPLLSCVAQPGCQAQGLGLCATHCLRMDRTAVWVFVFIAMQPLAVLLAAIGRSMHATIVEWICGAREATPAELDERPAEFFPAWLTDKLAAQALGPAAAYLAYHAYYALLALAPEAPPAVQSALVVVVALNGVLLAMLYAILVFVALVGGLMLKACGMVAFSALGKVDAFAPAQGDFATVAGRAIVIFVNSCIASNILGLLGLGVSATTETLRAVNAAVRGRTGAAVVLARLPLLAAATASIILAAAAWMPLAMDKDFA